MKAEHLEGLHVLLGSVKSPFFQRLAIAVVPAIMWMDRRVPPCDRTRLVDDVLQQPQFEHLSHFFFGFVRKGWDADPWDNMFCDDISKLEVPEWFPRTNARGVIRFEGEYSIIELEELS